MSAQSFQAVRRLNDAGAPLPLILANPAWQALMDKIDSNISERQANLEAALSKIPDDRRPSPSSSPEEDASESSSKRARFGDGSDLSQRKQALLAKINKIEGGAPATGAAEDDYEAYRRQCWLQYYEWMEKQKKGATGEPAAEASANAGASSEDEDEEIHNALLGLS
jgi:hypothetical protein